MLLEIDDTPFKKILGELMVYSARSKAIYQEIHDFLQDRDITDLSSFRLNTSPEAVNSPYCLEPSELLLAFTDSIRQRLKEPEEKPVPAGG